MKDFLIKRIVHKRDHKGNTNTTQKIKVYFNFIVEYMSPVMAKKEPTPEEPEETRTILNLLL